MTAPLGHSDSEWKLGDRVRVFPQSKGLKPLRGKSGTVVFVVSGYPMDGSLHVRLDGDETLGIGADCVERIDG